MGGFSVPDPVMSEVEASTDREISGVRGRGRGNPRSRASRVVRKKKAKRNRKKGKK